MTTDSKIFFFVSEHSQHIPIKLVVHLTTSTETFYKALPRSTTCVLETTVVKAPSSHIIINQIVKKVFEIYPLLYWPNVKLQELYWRNIWIQSLCRCFLFSHGLLLAVTRILWKVSVTSKGIRTTLFSYSFLECVNIVRHYGLLFLKTLELSTRPRRSRRLYFSIRIAITRTLETFEIHPLISTVKSLDLL
jgi:hypothetical protein